ncbi:GroES-like protein [Cylindrobasidium torrendii FP15055 ss-10]|uniref:GroES-like protein n=1 Tax=Cylindrobasidium torrendii FP15055 ss-10 TaxID=1314674 RepID=A0A0D7B2L0_9AGAR|nr:GroES-like protein [Cylindrobasidium torrendii FP15055 ss-10]
MSTTHIRSNMTAALYDSGNTDVVIDRSHPVPQPEDNQVVIKIAATGVCHSDVLWLSGAALSPGSYILGHECCGVPVKYGKYVDPKKIVPGKLYTWRAFSPCVSILKAPGLGGDGAYAEYILATPEQLVPVPENVTLEEASMASDAGTTAYNAVHNTAGINGTSNPKVLIFGIGGLGHLAVQIAKYYGAIVYAVDIKPEARKLALELGAVEAFDLLTLSQRLANKTLSVDITIDFVASSQTFGFATSALAADPSTPGIPSVKKLVVVGVSEETMAVNPFNFLLSNIHILFSLYGSYEDTIAILDLFSKGAVRGHGRTKGLLDVNEVLDELRAYEVKGRTVLIP